MSECRQLRGEAPMGSEMICCQDLGMALLDQLVQLSLVGLMEAVVGPYVAVAPVSADIEK